MSGSFGVVSGVPVCYWADSDAICSWLSSLFCHLVMHDVHCLYAVVSHPLDSAGGQGLFGRVRYVSGTQNGPVYLSNKQNVLWRHHCCSITFLTWQVLRDTEVVKVLNLFVWSQLLLQSPTNDPILIKDQKLHKWSDHHPATVFYVDRWGEACKNDKIIFGENSEQMVQFSRVNTKMCKFQRRWAGVPAVPRTADFCRAMLCKRGKYCHAVSVCCHVRVFCRNK